MAVCTTASMRAKIDATNDTDDDTNDDTDDGGRGNLYTIKVFWAGNISGWKYWNGSRKNSGS